MAVAPIRIPSLQQRNPIVDEQGRMTPEFARRLQDILTTLATAINSLQALPIIQEALAALPAVIQQAQDAADAAQAAADGASGVAASNAREQALVNSYIEPDSVITATTTTITIAAHTRRYADGTSAPVNGGTAAATAATDTDYVSYIDPERDGGAVTYIVSTIPPVQTGDTHVVGAVTIPDTGTVDGGTGPRRPGYVTAKVPGLSDEP